MTDPVYALIFAALAGGLLTAIVVPAPVHPVRDDAGPHLALLGAACLATIVMGILALLARPAESTVCGAIAWLLVMPCVWLARAPRSADGWSDEEQDDDDDGGSPSPGSPSAPPAPDDRLAGLQPSAWPAAHAAWDAPPRTMPVTATAATVRRMLAAQEAQTLRSAAALSPRPQAGRAADAAPQPPAAPRAPAPATAQRRVHAMPRVRADHRPIVRWAAADAHAGRHRATIGRRMLRRCRLWLWPAAAHDGRRHRANRDPRRDVSEPPSALRH